MATEIMIFETKDNEIKLTVPVENETVWLTQAQMTELFQVDRTVITRHVNNVFKENELIRESNVQKMHIPNSDRPVQFYSLEVIISVGYRVKSNQWKILFIRMSLVLKKKKERSKAFLQRFTKVRLVKMRTLL